MKQLLPGVRRYSEEVYPAQKGLFDQLASGQRPHTLFITCSDSRIDPSLITQTNPGEIFVIRNAGNLVPEYGKSHGGEEGTIEYAVAALKVSQIVVCGHSHCGAMGALLNKSAVESLPAVGKWIEHGESTLSRLQAGETDVLTTVGENVLQQAENLKTHPYVRRALDEGKLQIFGWIYHFEAGHITVYSPEARSFVSSSELDTSNDFKAFSI